jgi:peroxiredoxin Q/BCP
MEEKMLKENDSAPEFSLENQDGKITRLVDFSGQPLVLYFYPKDDTPGCTTEACNFRDDYSEFVDKRVQIVGVSPDSVKSHKKFQGKFELPFNLLSDPDHKVAELYGAWGLKKMYGREYEGILRTTFLIDKNGKVAKVFEGVKPADHSREVLEELAKLV